VARNILEHHLGKRQKQQRSYRIFVKVSWIRTMVTERENNQMRESVTQSGSQQTVTGFTGNIVKYYRVLVLYNSPFVRKHYPLMQLKIQD
jgi:hypothetical protein